MGMWNAIAVTIAAKNMAGGKSFCLLHLLTRHWSCRKRERPRVMSVHLFNRNALAQGRGFPGLGKRWIPELLLQTLPLLRREFKPPAGQGGWAGAWAAEGVQGLVVVPAEGVTRCLQLCTGTCAVALINCSWFKQTVLVFCAELNLALHNFLNEPAVCQGCTYFLVLPRAKKSPARSVAVKDLIGKEQKLPRSSLVQNHF